MVTKRMGWMICLVAMANAHCSARSAGPVAQGDAAGPIAQGDAAGPVAQGDAAMPVDDATPLGARAPYAGCRFGDSCGGATSCTRAALGAVGGYLCTRACDTSDLTGCGPDLVCLGQAGVGGRCYRLCTAARCPEGLGTQCALFNLENGLQTAACIPTPEFGGPML